LQPALARSLASRSASGVVSSSSLALPAREPQCRQFMSHLSVSSQTAWRGL
jgi:hypothetical protein